MCNKTQSLHGRHCKDEVNGPEQRKEPGRLVHWWFGGQAGLWSSHSLISATPNGGNTWLWPLTCQPASFRSFFFWHLDTSEGRSSTAVCYDHRWGTRTPAVGSRRDTGTAAGSRRATSDPAGSWGSVRTLGLSRKLGCQDRQVVTQVGRQEVKVAQDPRVQDGSPPISMKLFAKRTLLKSFNRIHGGVTSFSFGQSEVHQPDDIPKSFFPTDHS